MISWMPSLEESLLLGTNKKPTVSLVLPVHSLTLGLLLLA
jgi:hypothetical protein